MAESYIINPTVRLVESWGWGEVTDEECVEHYARLLSDPKFSRDYREIIDCRNARVDGLSDVTLATIGQIAVFDSGARRAVVVATEEQESVARKFAVYARDAQQTVEIFGDIGAAYEWLDAADGRNDSSLEGRSWP